MVGRGFLKPDLNKCRSDTPKAFRKLIEDCIQFHKEKRPEFKMVKFAFKKNSEKNDKKAKK